MDDDITKTYDMEELINGAMQYAVMDFTCANLLLNTSIEFDLIIYVNQFQTHCEIQFYC